MTNAAELVINDLDFQIDAPESYIERFRAVLTQSLIEARNISIACADSFNVASLLFKRAREVRKKIDAWKLEATAPFREKTAAINDRAKELTDPLKDVESIISLKIDSYHRQVEKVRKEEEASLEEARNFFGFEDTVFLPTAPKTIRAEGAMAYTKTVKAFRVIDLAQVPQEFLMINEKAVERAIKDGMTIPGIEIYKETKTQVRIR